MSKPFVSAYVGLGSNMGDPSAHVSQAIKELTAIDNSRLVEASCLYLSAPMGPQDQPDYINAVAHLETRLTPLELLHELQRIEAEHGRVRIDGERWGPRSLDLDLLLYGNEIIESEELTVPHVGLHERNFVLFPLFEIAPELRLPDNRRLLELLNACPLEGLERIIG